jgi:hypothetical protein
MHTPRFIPYSTAIVLFVLLCVVSITSQAGLGAQSAGAQSSPTSPRNSRGTPASLAPVPLDALVQRYGFVRVPATHLGGLYTVPVTIDTAPKELVFDSGMGEDLTLVTSFTDAIGVHGAPARDRIGFGAPVPTDTTHLSHLRIATLALEPLFLKISANDPPGGNGTLGAHFASTYHLILDYTQDVFYVHAPVSKKVSKNSNAQALPGLAPRPGDVAIPLTRLVSDQTHRVRYVLHATINAVPLLLVLDTGADLSLVLDQQRLHDVGLTPTSSSSVQGIGGSQESQTGSVDSVTVGSLKLGSLSYTALDMSRANQRGKEEGFPKLDGILGAGVLDAYGAIVDFGHGVLYLRK